MICNKKKIYIFFFLIFKSYIVTELLDTDLKRVLDKEHAKLNADHFKLFLY